MPSYGARPARVTPSSTDEQIAVSGDEKAAPRRPDTHADLGTCCRQPR